LSDNAILYGMLAQDPHTKLLGGDDSRQNLSNEPYGLAVAATHKDFVRFVNAVLERMRTTGRWTQLWNTWFSAVVHAPPPNQPPARYIDQAG
jgi:polar amino acid transport system substrate-binding protein